MALLAAPVSLDDEEKQIAAAIVASLASADNAWEVQGDSGRWHPCDEMTQASISEAARNGKNSIHFSARGFDYELNLLEGFQRNLSTGRCRKLRQTAKEAKEAAAVREIGPFIAEAACVEDTAALREIHFSTMAPMLADSATSALGGSEKRAAETPSLLAEDAGASPSVSSSKRRRKTSEGTTRASLSAASPKVAIAPSDGNEKLAEIFEEMAAIQKLKRDRFRAKAYDNAARTLRGHHMAILSGAQAKALEGIGVGMARRIDIVLETGELKELDDLKKDDDVIALREIRAVHGIGPVRAAELIGTGVRSLSELRAAVSSGKVHLDAAQSVGLKHVGDLRRKIPRAEMMQHESVLLKVKVDHPKAICRMVCGSYRRGKLESGDIDLMITAEDYTAETPKVGGLLLRQFVQALRDAGYITDDLACGTTKYMGVCNLGVGTYLHRRIDIRCFPKDQYHYGILYFTGSASLSVRLRMRAIELGMTLNEYCLQKKDTNERIAVSSEKEVFDILGMEYLEPSERG